MDQPWAVSPLDLSVVSVVAIEVKAYELIDLIAHF